MKNLIMIALTLIALLIVPPAFGQITVTHTDLQQPVGTMLVYNGNTNLPEANYLAMDNSPASDYTWDVTNWTMLPIGGSTMVNPATAPYSASFPTANQCFHTGNGTTGSWSYSRLDQNGWSNLGWALVQPPQADMINIFTDASLDWKLPLSNGLAWVSVMSYTLEFDSTSSTRVVDTTWYTVNGWGTLKRGNKTESVLRTKGVSKNVSVLTSNNIEFPPQTTNREAIHFISKNPKAQFTLSKSSSGGQTYYSASGSFEFFSGPTDVKEELVSEVVPADFEVAQNTPNPFNPATAITYSVANTADVQFDIINILGERVISQQLGTKAPGTYQLTWDGRSRSGDIVPSGIYFYRLTAGDKAITRKMILMK